jgi:hypothetical protein
MGKMIILEIFSSSKKYKAAIESRKGLFYVSAFSLMDGYIEGLGQVCDPYWSRSTKEVIIVDSLQNAEKIVIQELQYLSGEKATLQPELEILK